MTNYPNSIDNDNSIPRCEDGFTEYAGEIINALRDAVFSIEETLGTNPEGSAGDLVSRLAVSLNNNGTIKASALTGLGLVTLPIYNNQIANGAGIVESKLNLNYPTNTLYGLISALTSTINGINIVLTGLDTNFNLHIFGKTFSTTVGGDGYINRHVGSHIDINNGILNGYPVYTGIDPRDPAYNNPGLLDLDGYVRNAKTVMDALLQINNDFLSHALSLSSVKHTASFISVDTSAFDVIPKDKTDVQAVLDFIDDAEAEIAEKHRAEEHSNGIPRGSIVSRYENDGYNTIFGPFDCSTIVSAGGLGTVVFAAVPGALDWAFRQIMPGDKIHINYGGYLAEHIINTISYTPGTTYELTVDGYVLALTGNASAVLEKSKYDDNFYGALGVCTANHNYYHAPNDANVPASAIIVSPNCAAATGVDFCSDDFDSTHYMLYIAFYPTGNPADVNLVPPTNLMAIDVTGNKGTTPSKYTLQHIIETTNNAFRAGGYNYRFVAFEYKGQFGIALTDVIDNAAFSIISGTASGTTLSAGSFTNNVVGDATSPIKDPLGLGYTKAYVASPEYQDPTATSIPTKVITRKRFRKYNINGQYIDYLANGYLTNNDGYYDGYFMSRQALGTTRTRGTYRVYVDLRNTELKPGSTIVIHPTIDRTDASFKEQDYGRFIVESLDYGCCPGDEYTDITVITCTSLSGDPNFIATVPPPYLPVRIYFSEDSISFENNDGDKYRNLFEVYVARDGKTFAHKRARVDLSSPSDVRELDTSLGTGNIDDGYGWHINDASSKLRGFYPATAPATNLRRFVRFIINNYDATDDSYDGYIGQPNDSSLGGILNTGPVTRVRKGDVGRYYDQTGVDYIEIKFNENIFTTPLDISVPADEFRYKDIEIFETMRLNEEYMCLAVCEQFSSGSNKTTLWNVIDKRQFGTVSERNLTTSAIQFIEASDRMFRQNGVAIGFDYKGMSGSNLVFNGGTAVVNGTLVSVNNFTVFPFEMKTSSPPTTVTYALCLRADGTHELIVIDATSYNQDYTTGRERIYTLSEIIASRKDLLPIYIFTVVTASLTVNPDILDIRKFIRNVEVNTPLTLVGPGDSGDSPDTRIGNFASWKAIANYIKYATKVNSKIIVKGETNITDTIDFNDIPVEIYGEPNNTVYCYDTLSITLQSNITIDGLNFVRVFSESGLSYYSSGYGKATLGLVVTGNVEPVFYENIKIRNCSFDTLRTYRAAGIAHILFEETGTDSRSVFKNILIENNVFKEEDAQLDIAFVNKGGYRLSDPTDYSLSGQGTTLSSVIIQGNTGNVNSWIMLSSDNYDSGGGSSRGLSAYNVKILNNSFYHIWYNLSRYIPAGYDGGSFGFEKFLNIPLMHAELEISGNSFVSLMNRAIDGTFLGIDATLYTYVFRQVKVAGPSTHITNNRCCQITININGDVYNDGTYDYPKAAGPITIADNVVMSCPYNGLKFDPSDSYVDAPPSDYIETAISVLGNMSIGHEKDNLVNIECNTIGNEIKDFDDGSLTYKYNYEAVIFATAPCNIDNNTIEKCIIDNGRGIWLNYVHPITSGHGDDTYRIKITDNLIERGDVDIYSYIYIGGTDKINQIIVKDNTFDGYTVVDSPTTIADHYSIKYDTSIAYKLTLQRNVGQMFYTDLTGATTANIIDTVVEVGWKYKTQITASLVIPGGLRIVNGLETCLMMSEFSNTTYSLTPIVFNLPSYDGAWGLSVEFTVEASTTPARNMRIYASTQYGDNRSLSEFDQSIVIYPVRNITAGIDNLFATDTNEYLMHIDISNIYTIYTTYVSADRYFPLYISFLEESAPYDIESLVKTSSSVYEYVTIKNVKGQFRY